MKFTSLALFASGAYAAAFPSLSGPLWGDNIIQGNGNATFLRDLLSRNRAIAEERNRTQPTFYAESVANPQRPSAVLVACSDSRLPDALIAGQASGEIFSVRNIANQVPSTETAARASIEYAVASLGAYRIIVMGHDGCGGIAGGHTLAQMDLAEAAGYSVKRPVLPAAVDKWIQPLRKLLLPILLTARTDAQSPLVAKRSNVFSVHDHILHRRAEAATETAPGSRGELEIKKPSYDDPTLRLGIEENVRRQVNSIADDPFIQQQWALGRNVSVIGWVYSLRTGLIRDLAISRCLGGTCYNQGRLDGYGSLQM